MKNEFIDRMRSDYQSRYGFNDNINTVASTKPGLTEETIRQISKIKSEPKWMLDIRLRALKIFESKPMPTWGGDLTNLSFDEMTYYLSSSSKKSQNWDDVPDKIKKTFDRLGVPEAERRFLGGVGAQYESEVVYHHLQEDLEKQGVIFLDTDSALKEHEDIFRKFFGTVVPAEDNKFAALNSAAWSGGSFIYVPKNVKFTVPLQAYFRINAQNMGQFERTLIIADKGSSLTYIEGCTAPVYSTDSLHAAVVELIALEGAKIRYTTMQNWSNNVYNLVTKRAHAHADATVEWIDANIGSKLTMKYPSIYMIGPRARADILSVAFAGKGQHQDAGAKAIHMAPDTKSTIISKSVSKDGGRASYRGLVRVAKGATNCQSSVRCDALIMDEKSRSDTYPCMEIDEEDTTMVHEATVGKVGEDQIFYLMTRGLKESEALSMIILGFVEKFTKELPMEYAIEFNRLIQMEMEGSVG
jgi:Fe-S cluster assembly protein SufB